MDVTFNIVLIHIGTNDIPAFNDAKFRLLLHKVISEIRAKNNQAVIGLASILPMPKFGNSIEAIRVSRKIL